MATGVGLHIAEHACTAAVVSDDGDPHFIIREPILHMSEDGDATLGGATAPPGYTQTITGFISAVGDPAGVAVDDGEAYRGEDLLATAMFCLINLTADHLNGPAEFYATHPGGWPATQVFALRGALDYLGLKSVALIGEDELPPRPRHAPGDAGRYFAESAGRAALAVVLETPAGATPPDPTTAENSFLDTVVMPKLGAGDTPAKAYSAVTPTPTYPAPAESYSGAAPAEAYSAAAPAADPEATYGGPSLGVLAAGLGVSAAAGALPAAEPPSSPTNPPAPVPETPGPTGKARPTGSKISRRTAVLVAAAALVGLLIGAVGVTALLRTGAAEPGPAPTTSVTTPPAAPPPPAAPQPLAPPAPTYEPEPTYVPEPTVTPETPPATTPPPVTVTTQSPVPTTSVPSSTVPSGPTLTDPTETTETTTTRSRPGFDFFPFPNPFRTEDRDLPDTGSQEGRQEEAR
ncbi:hypothetical protein [Nocardia sp. CA-290969]|uniref:hypothetical protein n=1 Tax=Nocardia sp. CA-290969 TaxID=3239986 RepID=UPI003D8F6C52